MALKFVGKGSSEKSWALMLSQIARIGLEEADVYA